MFWAFSGIKIWIRYTRNYNSQQRENNTKKKKIHYIYKQKNNNCINFKYRCFNRIYLFLKGSPDYIIWKFVPRFWEALRGRKIVKISEDRLKRGLHWPWHFGLSNFKFPVECARFYFLFFFLVFFFIPCSNYLIIKWEIEIQKLNWNWRCCIHLLGVSITLNHEGAFRGVFFVPISAQLLSYKSIPVLLVPLNHLNSPWCANFNKCDACKVRYKHTLEIM